MSTFLFVGLGNHGSKYQKTFHNAGFICVEQILSSGAKSFNAIENQWLEKYSGLHNSLAIASDKIIFIKPQTYMNNSGICVTQFKNFFKVENDNIFVFHDDIDLKSAQIKFKKGGGHAGHNGLKSLDAHIGNDYHRIRIGVGRPPEGFDVANFVLSQMKDGEIDAIERISNLISNNLIFLLEKKFSLLQEKINSNF